MQSPPSPPVGITTTIPVEIIYSAGRNVVDLNNLFMADPDPGGLIELAERAGFPAAECAWIKGIYGVVKQNDIREVVGVVEGDCSDTGALLEVLQSEGRTIHTFGYPHVRTVQALTLSMQELALSMGTSLSAAGQVKLEFDEIRALAFQIDRLAAAGKAVSSRGLFEALLMLTDFAGDPAGCRQKLYQSLEILQRSTRFRHDPGVNLGMLGVPTIFTDLWEVFEDYGARFAYQEVPRQFAMLHGIGRNLVDTYLEYTYPYDVFSRIRDIAEAVRERQLRGLVHYVQSFCHRRIQDRLLREHLPVPILTMEGDRPGPVDARTRTRIEAFMENLA